MPNDARHLLMIAYYFPPLGGGGTLRTLKFVRYLPEFGWRPIVLTVANSSYLALDEALVSQIPIDTRVVRTPAFLPARFFRRSFSHSLENESNFKQRKLLTAIRNVVYACAFIPDEFVGWYPFAVRAGLAQIRRLTNVEKGPTDESCQRMKPSGSYPLAAFIRWDRKRFSGKDSTKQHDHHWQSHSSKRSFQDDNPGDCVIFSTSPPNTTHLIALRLAQRTGRPWVADLRDLWDMYPDSYNPFRWKWRSSLDDLLERKILSRADRIIVVSEEMRAHLLKKLPRLKPEKVLVITNGFDPNDFEEIAHESPSKKFTIVHAGTLFPWRRLRPFLCALRILFEKRPEWQQHVRLNLIGLVPHEEQIELRESGMDGISEVLGYRPHRETLTHLISADAQLLLVGEIPHADQMVTGKIFDYMGSGRPILAIGPEGSSRRMVRQYHLGAEFGMNETERIATTLEHWIEQHRNGGLPLRRNVPAKFHRREQAAALSMVLDGLQCD